MTPWKALVSEARNLADNPWAEYLPDVHKMMHSVCDALEEAMRRVEVANSLVDIADGIEHDSWCGHGGLGKCDCNRSVLSLEIETWRKLEGKGE